MVLEGNDLLKRKEYSFAKEKFQKAQSLIQSFPFDLSQTQSGIAFADSMIASLHHQNYKDRVAAYKEHFELGKHC